ncbi:MAG: hypothetical protein FJ128_00590 [Deltaproteobacteria bacterium]|nr:hypothetical protein [Deltaproteobacteria bacterium]
MRLRRHFAVMLAALSLLFLLGGTPFSPRPAQASTEDAAIFYDDLSQYGTWVDYGDYGPVWYPNSVEEGWRPYLNGRWVPTEQGYVFESEEPWAWATYHYGNWMPTDEYGWVWAPGRTWYPSTVNWRTSPENTPEESAYVGWAPIPPPNYQPPASYYPAGGYTPGMAPMDTLAAPFYIFVRAASFLLGFAQPFAPTYTYISCGCLAPPAYLPVVYPRTIIINNFVAPTYYPTGVIVAGRPIYNWGPPIPWVARWHRMNVVQINNYVRQVNIYNVHNVVPPQQVLVNRPWLRQVLPPAIVARQPLPAAQPVTNLQLVKQHIVRPRLAPAVAEAPRWTAQIPRATITRVQKGAGIPGAGLPPRATMKLDPRMQTQIQKLPPGRQIKPILPVTRQPAGAAPVMDQQRLQQQQLKQQQLQQQQLKQQQLQQQQQQRLQQQQQQQQRLKEQQQKQQMLQQQQLRQQQLQQQQQRLQQQQLQQQRLKEQQQKQQMLQQQQLRQQQLQQQQQQRLQQQQLQQQRLKEQQQKQQMLQQQQLRQQQQQQLQQQRLQQQQLQQQRLKEQQQKQQMLQQQQLKQQQLQQQQQQQQQLRKQQQQIQQQRQQQKQKHQQQQQ